ncbi:hypothetical protein AYR62_01265 [Secundilactobacillus paracollinoides]|uniref:Uncharacterized protein n=1 Tax=Secundilactobacillus paracollinoides TaxID=240427 RepID=A0A1B2IVB1_9LACO|nr:hypothetical protein [Secundilactobacillus paracollinoides]ANZ60183.1 hypothetical protein AYR61_01665 [Secundilactobacillus paracollinoides]ANZ62864.1 hypothetical protein AYR62_01265 [Secundilactobacillus paracollinoides]ANZ65977.1 hypothetical protein AYR63_01685 [Secundilactobacillus paracollinoides]
MGKAFYDKAFGIAKVCKKILAVFRTKANRISRIYVCSGIFEIKFSLIIRELLFNEQGRYDGAESWFKVVVTDYKTW